MSGNFIFDDEVRSTEPAKKMKGCTICVSDVTYLSNNVDSLANAVQNGLKVIEPGRDQLFIDIDTEWDFDEFVKRFEWMKCNTRALANYKACPSKSGLPKRHVVVNLFYEVSDEMRVALQAVLNSDPQREFYNVCRMLNRDKKANVFFEKE